MRIDVKLYGRLKRYAPDTHASFSLTLGSGAHLAEVREMLCIAKERHVALINGRRANGDARFSNGDTLVLLPPISGG